MVGDIGKGLGWALLAFAIICIVVGAIAWQILSWIWSHLSIAWA